MSGVWRPHSGLAMGTTPGPQRFEPAWAGGSKAASALVGEEVTVVIRLAIDTEGHPCGSLRCGDGEPAGFAGWLDLMAEISAVLGPRESPEWAKNP